MLVKLCIECLIFCEYDVVVVVDVTVIVIVVIVCCVWLVGCLLLCVVGCLLLFVCCCLLLFVVRCLLFVVSCLLFVAQFIIVGRGHDASKLNDDDPGDRPGVPVQPKPVILPHRRASNQHATPAHPTDEAASGWEASTRGAQSIS